MKTRLYLDTSIPSAFYDTSKPMRQLLTQKWFEHEKSNYLLSISTLTIQEIEKLGNAEKRNNITDLIISSHAELLEITEEALNLS